MYVLGIDGGGTKTKAVIAKPTGEIVAEALVGATNPNSVTEPALKLEFNQLISSLQTQFAQDFTEIKHVFAGMSGADHQLARKKIHRLLTTAMPASLPVTINNDAITALYSGTLGDPGIVQISGTGSITYGLNQEGVTDRVGGWGYLIGEKGSGYAIGSDGLNEAFRAHDGLGQETILQDLFVRHFAVQTMSDIIPAIYQAPNIKEKIASLSGIVFEAFDEGDSLAQHIIRENTFKMGESIAALTRRLFKNVENVPIVLVGGLFNRADVIKPYLEGSLTNLGLSATLILPEIEPVAGTVIAAFKEARIEIDEDFASNFSFK